VLFLTDTPKFLFTPQALAVVFAMLASYLLSRTLVPILIDVLVAKEFDRRFGAGHGHTQGHAPEGQKPGFLARFQTSFERKFEQFHRGYVGLLHATLTHRTVTFSVVGGVFLVTAGLFQFIGQDYFPQIDGGQMTLHVRTRSGMRIETAEQTFAGVENVIREVIPKKDLGLVIDNIGLPAVNYNFAFGDGSFLAYNDGQILISLNEGHKPTTFYMKELRRELRERFPDVLFYFQPADMITRILGFGTITPIDIQITGRNDAKDLEVAKNIERRVKAVRGAVDVHLQQITDAPEYFVEVDRQLASELGLTQQQIANAMNVSLAGSFQVNPNFWADPVTGIPYQLWVQTPEYRNDSLTALNNTPLFAQTATDANPSVVTQLSSVATLKRQYRPIAIDHYNTQPKYDVLASVQDRDLGSVRKEIQAIIDDEQKNLPAPDKITIRGQIESMDSAFRNIGIGLAIAMIAVYLLMAINYQTWGDPFVVLAALPVAFCGIVASLFITQTTFSIPSLFGAIMSVGVASANSILLVTFAKEYRERTGASAFEAAIKAGETRLRPVLMTAGAMFVGLIPMALGLGEGSEQNAALARAVLGGIVFATCSTLLFVPFLYTIFRRKEIKPLENYL
jgi:multidrug efflux pump subunit AcrB